MKIVWIIVTSGKHGSSYPEDFVFEGTVDHWKDVFYSNPTRKNIEEFCGLNDYYVEFLEEIPEEFKKEYVKENLPILEE